MSPTSRKEPILLLIGGSGFIGSALGEKFVELGWKIHLLTRKIRPLQTSFPCRHFAWDGLHIPQAAITGTQAVINLAGQAIADKPWTSAYRKEILDSRINSTRALVQALSSLDEKPEVVVQASAIGFFGMQSRNEACHEDSAPGTDFLADVCQAWEKEAAGIAQKSRLCIARIGLVLGWEGGALPKLWDIYASGLGSTLGHGKQWMNWVHLADILKFFTSAIQNKNYTGVYHLVAPDNLDNHSFHHILSEKTASLKFLTVPGFCLTTLMGKRAELLLKAPQVKPSRLEQENFKFLFPNFALAMADLLAERSHPGAHYLKIKQWIPDDIDRVWEFFSSAENLEKITPSSLGFHVKHMSTKKIEKNTLIDYALKIRGIPITWRSNISEWSPKSSFVDEQVKGPYRLWFHRHLFRPLAGGTMIEDRVEYRLPLFPFGQLGLLFVKKDLAHIFEHRREAVARIF